MRSLLDEPHLPPRRDRICSWRGGLGQGLGITLGIKLAEPGRPVILFIGDGSFLFNPIVQALGASRNMNLPILIVVMNNHRYAAMQEGHEKHYSDGVGAQEGFTYGVSIDGVDYEGLGEKFGFPGARAATPEEFRAAFEKGLETVQAGKTVIINAAIER